MSKKQRRGFTLIELLVVIAIIGILMALLFPAFTGVMEAARRAKAKNDLVQLAIAIKAYQTEYGKLPILPGVADAGEHTAWFQGPKTSSHYNSGNRPGAVRGQHRRAQPQKNRFPRNAARERNRDECQGRGRG
ncbi:MAG: type II secretion system protein [Verrucomicrobiota bacterium]